MKRNFTRLLLSAVLMMCCTVMANAQIDVYTGDEPRGSGTQSDPYKIDNYDKLYRFSLMVNAGYYSPAYAELTADITADGVHPWIPIGNDTRMYINEFNGNGHVIRGLTINNGNSADACCLGLFGKIGNNGSVHDVGVENCYFYGQNRVGAICGDLASGEVYNCWSSGYICVNSASGGLVGSCWYDGILKNCYTSCNVVVSQYTDQYVGGVCGSVAGKVENCFMLEKTGDWAENPIGATYGETSVINNVAAKPNGAFSSGEVCWLLNGGVTDGSQGWYQTIGTDNMPTVSKSSKTVSRCSANCAPGNYIYNNDNVETDTYHALAYRPKYSCVTTGYNTEHWECLGCHKLYSDRECTHEINQSDLGVAKSAVIINKDADWKYADKLSPSGCHTTLYSCYYIDTPAPGDEVRSTKTTSISFTVNVDNFDFNLIWYFNQTGQWDIPIGEGEILDGFIPDADVDIKYMVNGIERRKDQFHICYVILEDWDPGSFRRSEEKGSLLELGRLMKGDVVKIEISLLRSEYFDLNRNNCVVFSIPQAVHPEHQFKHINATSLYREHWECEHCHNVFTSNAHTNSDEDICYLDDLAYEEPKKNDGYYEIRNEGTLYWLAREVNEKGNTTIKARLIADIKVNNNVLDQNGNLNDASWFRRWTPIGNDDHPFIGEFDGNGHTISGLYQKDDNQDAGLFGYMTEGGKIENVIVKDSYLFGQYPTLKEGQQGMICYRNQNGGSVTDSYISMGKVFGGYVSVASNSERHVTDTEFNSGEATWMLNRGKISTKWRQQIGKNPYPVLTGNYLVNHSEEKGYYNETMCEKENGIHSFIKEEVKKCDNSTIVYWHCSACGKDFTDADRTKEETDANKSSHFPEHVMCIVPTSTKEGCYGYYKCTKCSGKFKDEPCNQPWANDNDLIVPKAKDNEIWYATTDGQQIAHGVSYKTNECHYGLSKIVLADGVTEIADNAFKGKTTLMSMYIPSSVKKIGKYSFSGCTFLQSVLLSSGLEVIDDNAFDVCTGLTSITIPETVTRIGKAVFVVGSENTSLKTVTIPENSQLETIDDNAFNRCRVLQSIRIPSSVKKIGNSSFWGCTALESVTFCSLPVVDQYAFGSCGSLSSKVLDLTDSDKPYIGTSLDNYPGFTEARYRRTLANDGTWGTIVLPFKPASTEGLKFYALQSMTLRQAQGESGNGGSLTFIKVDAPDAGVPYLFRNEGESADFTLTAETPSSIELNTQEIGTNFKMKGSFQQNQLDGAQNGNLYYLKDNEFYHANGKINIAPFRAYIEGSGTSGVKSFLLVVSDNGEDITAIPGIMDEDGTIDETEAIYDLSGRRLAAPVKGQINIIRTKSGKTVKRLF